MVLSTKDELGTASYLIYDVLRKLQKPSIRGLQNIIGSKKLFWSLELGCYFSYILLQLGRFYSQAFYNG